MRSVEPKIAKQDRKRLKWEKTSTLIQVTVDANGIVQDAHVVKSSLDSMKTQDPNVAAILDQRCLDAVNQYQFEPATLNGKPVPVLINISVAVHIF